MLGDLGASAAPMARAAGMQVRLLVGWCGLRGHLWGLALRRQGVGRRRSHSAWQGGMAASGHSLPARRSTVAGSPRAELEARRARAGVGPVGAGGSLI